MTLDEALARLRACGSPANVAGMARFGITPKTEMLDVSVWEIRRLGKEIGTDHRLARALWRSRVHEARVLATVVADPARLTEAQADRWVRSLDSWDVCDQLCGNLLDRTPFAARKALEWSRRDEEFVKRAGFSLMCYLAVHDKTLPDETFAPFFVAIEREADDDRNFVRKAVNWALRQIGKRNPALNRRAIAVARRLGNRDSRAARWIASDALRELQSGKVAAGLTRTEKGSRPRRQSRRRA